jgi:predicted nucleotidyltransferase
MTRELDRDAILDLLTELGTRLEDVGIQARFYIVGGAAMLLAYGRDQMTRDIDAVFEPKKAVYDVARKMADEKPWLGEDWLNDGVKGFIRGPDPGIPQVIHSSTGVSIQVASPQRLLAMKVAAARIERDADDIVTLARLVGAQSIQDVFDIADQEYGELLHPRCRFLVEEILSDLLPRHNEEPE